MRARFPLVRIVLMIGDICIVFAAITLALIVRHGEMVDSSLLTHHFYVFVPIAIVTVLLSYLSGLYGSKWRYPYSAIARYTVWAIALYGLYFYFFSPGGFTPKATFIFFIIWQVLLMILSRIICSKMWPYIENTVFVHEDNFNEILHSDILLDERVKLIVDDELSIDRFNTLSQRVPNTAIIAFRSTWMEEHHGKVDLKLVNPIQFREYIKNSNVGYYIFKRFLDIIISLPVAVVTIILYPFVSLAIWMEDRGSPVIWQRRVGKYGKVFRVPKFRSMTTNDSGIWPTEGDTRITRVGKFLRTSRIDELPQIFSVFIGDMSLIGPRPDIEGLYQTLVKEIPHYDLRTLVTPGLSGWAQVTQEVVPHTIEDTKDRLSYDFYYIKHQSWLLDLVIVVKTIKTLLERRGS